MSSIVHTPCAIVALSLSYLKARLAVMLGGRTAEEIVFGEVTSSMTMILAKSNSCR